MTFRPFLTARTLMPTQQDNIVTFSEDFLINLAAGLAYDLLKAGAARLKTATLGEPAQVALRGSYEAGFRAMLEVVAAGLDRDHQALVDDVFRKFVGDPAVTLLLLDMALAGAELPDLPALRDRFAGQFDRTTLPVDFDRALVAFHSGLTGALVLEASRKDSPLFNRVNLGRILALQILLRDQACDLAAIREQLARLEAQGGSTIYNIVIEQATNVAIGDGATVQGAPPPAHVQQILDEMLKLLRGILAVQATSAHPPANSQLTEWPGHSGQGMTDSEYRAIIAGAFRKLYFPLSDLGEEIDLDEVYVSLPLVKAVSVEAMLYQSSRKGMAPDEKVAQATGLLGQNERAAIVGIVGMGKTTSLRYLTWLYAERPEHRFCWRKMELTPFYAQVHDLAEWWPAERRTTPEAFLDGLAKACAHAIGGAIDEQDIRLTLGDKLKEKRAVVLLDALDEYKATLEMRQAFVGSLQHLWYGPYTGNAMVISSRPYGFLNPMGYPQYQLREIDDVDVMAFKLGDAILRRTQQNLTDDERNAWLDSLSKAIQNSNWAALATPLYLTLMIIMGARASSAEDGSALLRSLRGLADPYRLFLMKTIDWEERKPGSPNPGVNKETALLILGYLAYYVTLGRSSAANVKTHIAQDVRVEQGPVDQTLAFWQKTGLTMHNELQDVWLFRHAGFREFGVALALKHMRRSAEGRAQVKRLRQEWSPSAPEWQTVWHLFYSMLGTEQSE